MENQQLNNIDTCPSLLIKGHATYSTEALKKLFDARHVSHVMDFPSPSSDNREAKASLKNIGRLSLSGAQPKFGMIIDRNNHLRYSSPEEQSTFILKPRPTAYHIIDAAFCPANENLTMQLASQVYGIETAANGLCFYNDGVAAYITRRFDIFGNTKLQQEDFASLSGLTKANGGSEYKYINGSYEECAEIIATHVKSPQADLLRFFQVVLFNFITLNDDAHLKNFSLLSIDGGYRLSPAYDLINTSLHLYEPGIFALRNGLFKEGMDLCDTRQVSCKDFIEFGTRIGLPEAVSKNEISRFSAPNSTAIDLIDRSFLSQELKQRYARSFTYRQKLLAF